MIQQVNTTHEEKVKMYMKCSKKELAEMLARRDAIDFPPVPTEPGIYVSGSDWEGYEITHVYGRPSSTSK